MRFAGVRRAVLLAVGVAVIGAVAVLAFGGAGSGGGGGYRVDAIFDVARGIGPQQVVKIAGAQAGTVTNVRLTSDYKARVEMTVSRQFGPFRANASCQIEPEGIISENFVECDPGSPSAPPLAPDSSGTPTVPVSHTAEPISLQTLFDIWRTPVSQRLSVLLDELGIGVSGRDSDIRQILDDANPSLAAAQRAIALINRQRGQLQQLLVAADPVVSRLAASDGAVKRFISAGAKLTGVTGARSGALSATIARLPALLHSAQPALRELAAVGAGAPPLLNELRAAGPSLTKLTTDVPQFATQADSTLAAIDPALSHTGSVLRTAIPTLRRTARFATDADPAGESLDRLLVSLRDSGAFESLLRGLYNGAALTSHYSVASHVIFADLLINQCVLYSTVQESACAAHLNGGAKIPGGYPNSHRGHHRVISAATTKALLPDLPATTWSVITKVLNAVSKIRLPKPAAPAGGSAGSLKQLLDFLLG